MAKTCSKCGLSFSNSKIGVHEASCLGKPEDEDLARALGVVAEDSVMAEFIEVKAEETVKPAEKPAAEATDIEAVLRKMVAEMPDDDPRKELAEKEITRLYAEPTAAKQARGWAKFDEEFKAPTEQLINELVEKYGLEAVNQRITITFPEGKAAYTRGLKGKNGGGGGGGSRDGFPKQWGKAVAGEGDGAKEYSSPSKMAEKLSCKVNGVGAAYSDMVAVFDGQGHEVLELPAGDKLNELLSKQSDPVRKARLEKLSGKVFRVKA